MFRKSFIALVAGMCALFSAGAEELIDGSTVIAKNGWGNFSEVLTLSEAGKLKTGSLELDWPVLLSKFRTGAITARELWTQAHALAHNPPTENELWPLWFTFPKHIIIFGNDPELSQEIMTLLTTNAKGTDPAKRQAAARGLASVYMGQNKFALAWPYLCEPGGEMNNFAWAAKKLLASEQQPPADIYAGLRTVLLRRDKAQPAQLLTLTRLMIDAANAAAIPNAEVKATLLKIDQLYISYTVGESEDAKKWGEFVGAVEETAKRY